VRSTLTISGMAVFALLSGCGSSHSSVPEAMKDKVKADLTDPASAEFGRYVQDNHKERDWACVEIIAGSTDRGSAAGEAARLTSPPGEEQWTYAGIGGTFEECAKGIKEMGRYDGGPR
jgi:hypothetical protein